MSDEEVWKFIDQRKSLQVATLNRDGSPHLTTLWFAVMDGDIVFETYTKSQKILNLQRDPRISVLVEDGDRYDQLRGVTLSGTADLVTDPEKVHALALEVMSRNTPGVSKEQLDGMAQKMAAKRTGVVIKPTRIVSWDHSKLGGVGL
ncbi:MAG: TIGR03618 family F420-dependent PPOX class oxidoreductase [Myxococcota bacterium]